MTQQTPGQIEYASMGLPVPFQKWRTGTMAYGIVAIVFGGFSCLMGAIIPLTLMMPKVATTPRHIGTVMGVTLLYLAIGVSLIWLGIGCVRMRRWVRPLVLTIGTMMVVCGVLAIFMMILIFPALRDTMPATPTQPAATPPGAYMMGVIMGIALVVMLLIGIPIAFVLFFKSPSVKAMLDFCDPVPRWTDRCPIPALGVVVGLAIYAVTMLIAIPQAIFPVFGKLLIGPSAMCAALGVGIVLLIFARLAFRLRPSGWWGALIIVVLWALSYGITSMRSNALEQYRAAGYTDAQLDQIQHMQHISRLGRFTFTLPILILAVGYLLYVRKYFFRPLDVAQIVPPQEPPQV